MESDDASPSTSWLRQHGKTAVALLFLLAAATFFRVYFNYEPAINGGTLRFAGNDDYYHLRVVEHIVAEGNHLQRDPLLNYPLPGANPRPPFYNWDVAILGRVLEWTTGMSADHAAAYSLEWGSALWGILTVIPVWLIGRSLYSNRAGLWAGFLIAASPAHIQRGGFGLGDHDAFILFWIVLGAYFLVRALRLTRDDTRVERWNDVDSIAHGFGRYVEAHREGLAYGFLAGVAWAAVALSWEGFAYITAIYAVYYVLQLFTNQIRRRDSTGDILLMGILFGTITFVALPYYWSTGNLYATITANTYIFVGCVAFSLLLVPTRDLPSVLVLPGIAVMGFMAWVVLTFVFPDIGQQLFSANGYFQQTKLYSTIAEAQRTQLGVFVFSIGFMTFFLALVAFGFAIVRFFKQRERDQLFLVLWALVGIYMAFAAARFVFNASPVFAVLAGWMVDRIAGWMNWRERVREFASYRHESWAKAVKSIAGTRQVAGALFLGLTLVLPNVWFSFDAGFPGEVRQRERDNHPSDSFLENQTGAFGQGFLNPDWIQVYGWLEGQDAIDDQGRPVLCEKRPGHIAWWDYGFWEVALGCHPTVADNFQNGYDISGRFLAAQSEKAGIEFLTIRLLEGDWIHQGGRFSPAVQNYLTSRNATLPGLLANPNTATYDHHQRILENASRTLEDAVDLYMGTVQATSYHIGYFLTDLRMLPLDFYQTPTIESGSIFYAPVYLANKNPDDFVQTVYIAQGGTQYPVKAYTTDAQGNSRQLPQPEIRGPDGGLYLLSGPTLVRLTPDGKQIDYAHSSGGRGIGLERIQLDFKDPFYATLFYRGYVGGDGTRPTNGGNYHSEFLCNFPSAGANLRHFRLTYGGPDQPAGPPQECQAILQGQLPGRPSGAAPSVRLLKFYWGAELSGRVTSSGTPLGGVTVQVYDDLGVPHDASTTDAEGRYTLLMPFSLPDENGTLKDTTVRVLRGGLEMSNRTFQVSEAQAMRRAEYHLSNGDFDVAPGSLDVFAYEDHNRDGHYNATGDTPAAGAELTWGGYNATTGSDGRARFPSVLPGGDTVRGALPFWTTGGTGASVRSGETTSVEVAFEPAAVQVLGMVQTQEGKGVSAVAVNVTAKDPEHEHTEDVATPPFTDGAGNFTAQVQPGGNYTFTVDAPSTENGTSVRYQGSVEVYVPIGRPAPEVKIVVDRI